MSYAECRHCCSGCSGGDLRVEDWADRHEDENPDHRVDINYSEDDFL